MDEKIDLQKMPPNVRKKIQKILDRATKKPRVQKFVLSARVPAQIFEGLEEYQQRFNALHPEKNLVSRTDTLIYIIRDACLNMGFDVSDLPEPAWAIPPKQSKPEEESEADLETETEEERKPAFEDLQKEYKEDIEKGIKVACTHQKKVLSTNYECGYICKNEEPEIWKGCSDRLDAEKKLKEWRQKIDAEPEEELGEEVEKEPVTPRRTHKKAKAEKPVSTVKMEKPEIPKIEEIPPLKHEKKPIIEPKEEPRKQCKLDSAVRLVSKSDCEKCDTPKETKAICFKELWPEPKTDVVFEKNISDSPLFRTSKPKPKENSP